MKHIRYTTGEVSESGVFKINQHEDFSADMKMFAGKRLEVLIKPLAKKRSDRQNRYYWGNVIREVRQGLKDLGYGAHLLEPETVHEYLKEKFLKDVIVSDLTGEAITITKSTSELSTSEFMDYIAEIQQWASEFLSIQISDPQEQSTMNF